MVHKEIGTILTQTTPKGTVIQYKVIAIADGDKTYGLGRAPAKGTAIIKRMRKNGTLIGKNRIWAA